MKSIKSLKTAGIFSLMGLAVSCVSTETLEAPSSGPAKSNEIALVMSSPSNGGTRADNNHKLRYVAKLYDVTVVTTPTSDNFLQRKEVVEGEDRDEKGQDIVKFKVEPNKTYAILVFADYIPSSSVKNEDGYYADCYYDTQSTDTKITVKPFQGNGCINNDNYDCFNLVVDKIYKKEEGLSYEKILKRATAKVRFVANVAPDPNDFSLSVSNFSYANEFNQYGAASWTHSKNNNYTFNTPSNAADNEIFYFYTLAGDARESLGEITFKVTTSQEDPINVSVTSGRIFVQSNYITTVKGKFYPEPEIEEEDNPDDYITLMMAPNKDWNNPDHDNKNFNFDQDDY